jgi:hypothetical protein
VLSIAFLTSPEVSKKIVHAATRIHSAYHEPTIPISIIHYSHHTLLHYSPVLPQRHGSRLPSVQANAHRTSLYSRCVKTKQSLLHLVATFVSHFSPMICSAVAKPIPMTQLVCVALLLRHKHSVLRDTYDPAPYIGSLIIPLARSKSLVISWSQIQSIRLTAFCSSASKSSPTPSPSNSHNMPASRLVLTSF